MDFDNIQKIWDSQNNVPMYTFSEEALQERIQLKSKGINRMVNVNEFGLLAISWLAATILGFRFDGTFFDALPIVSLVCLGFYILWMRRKRKQKLKDFDHSLLGELDLAIENMKLQTRKSQTFFLWFLAPVMIPTVVKRLNMETPISVWLILLGSIVLSLVVVWLGLRFSLLPKKRELEKMRSLITQEVD